MTTGMGFKQSRLSTLRSKAALLTPVLLLVGVYFAPQSAWASTLEVDGLAATSAAGTVGKSVSIDVTFIQASGPTTSLTVTPAVKFGVTADVSSASLVHIGGVPDRPASIQFTLEGTNETDTESSVFTLHVTCPSNISIDSSTADACLADIAVVDVGEQGAVPTDTFTAIAPAGNDPHVAYNGQADGCASCHRTHGDRNQTFVVNNTVSHSVECLTCHDGTGAFDLSGTRATTKVGADYSSVSGSGHNNNPSTRTYYSHDALAVNTGHRAAQSDENGDPMPVNEFEGVANRHSDCVDCHDPHSTSVTPGAVQRFVAGQSAGWSLSGATQGASVALATADTSTAFVGRATVASNFEYQLCIKCHSGFTVLGANSVNQRSTDWLDKTAEVDSTTVGNLSYHPIASKGTNQTETMTASLSGTSAYKLWRFAVTDTVRCTNCHAGSAVAEGPGQPLAPHAAVNRGILILPYKDRQLAASDATFDEHEFALCFACHTDVPFTTSHTTSATAFRYHAFHMETATVGAGQSDPSTDIDTPFAGQGHALCAECHFRSHSTKFKVTENGQQVTGTRLVNFAPNVQPVVINGNPVLK